ncbi:MAG: hypothetical protein KC777_20045 [Cyanobacteria bacterium HKST-UBA02]|nr:hypothetical protein [Cyanobacteria bacterium HKST-UBA02]
MKSETWLILIVTVSIVAMIGILLTGRSSVQVGTVPPAIETRTLKANERPPELDSSSEGLTKWEFKCPAEVDYQLVDDVDDQGGSFVRIKVTGVRVNLSLPITVYLPENPSEELKMHEAGHVEICKRVYADGEARAEEVARSLVGKVYSGTGADKTTACTLAVNLPLIEFSGLYDSAIAKKAQDLS